MALVERQKKDVAFQRKNRDSFLSNFKSVQTLAEHNTNGGPAFGIKALCPYPGQDTGSFLPYSSLVGFLITHHILQSCEGRRSLGRFESPFQLYCFYPLFLREHYVYRVGHKVICFFTSLKRVKSSNISRTTCGQGHSCPPDQVHRPSSISIGKVFSKLLSLSFVEVCCRLDTGLAILGCNMSIISIVDKN